MHEKHTRFIESQNPTEWDSDIWLLALLMGALGGVAKILITDNRRRITAACILRDCLYSAIVGLGAYFAANAIGLPSSGAAAAAGIGGHMGAKLMALIEHIIEQRIKDRK